MRLFRGGVLFLSVAMPLVAVQAPGALAASDHWVGTWATAPVVEENRKEFLSTPTTLRQIVHVSIGGSTVRVVFTNELGTDPLTISGATVALSADMTTSAIKPGTARPLTFSGHAGMVIPPGAVAVSDPVPFTLPALADLDVTTTFPAQTIHVLTEHTFADAANFDAPGDQLQAATLSSPHDNSNWRFLKSVDVLASAKDGAIVAFGDSITDGAHSTKNANARWPDVLAQRLHANHGTDGLAVLNTGIGGNRVLHDGTGPSALARFGRDVVQQAGVKYVIVLESINDIGHAADPLKPYDIVSADDLIAGLSQLATRAHTHGIKIIGATLTPYVGAKYQSPKGEQMRQAVNEWIRTTHELDGVIDFDKMTTDPAHPGMFLPSDDSGDHLHPGDAGYKVMGDGIDLKLFK